MNEPLKISILDITNNENYEMLCELLKKFVIDTYVRNKAEFSGLMGEKKFQIVNRAIREFEGREELSVLSSNDLTQIKKGIEAQIEIVRQHANDNGRNVQTRYYILKDGDKVVAFQQAQISKNPENGKMQGWRNLAFAEQEYAGKCGKVVNTYGNIIEKNFSEAVYQDIGQWFKENSVSYERTCTGVNMLDNIAAYISLKFLPINKNRNTIFLAKDLEKDIDKRVLGKVYSLYRKHMQRQSGMNADTIMQELESIKEFAGLTDEQKQGLVQCFLKEEEKESATKEQDDGQQAKHIEIAHKIKQKAMGLYTSIKQKGMEAITDLFSEGKTLQQGIRFDTSEEYLKRMILSQMNIDGMLLTHLGYDAKAEYTEKSNRIREQLNSGGTLRFDEDTINSLFGNTLGIASEEEYEEWNKFLYDEREKNLDHIYFEEEFKLKYEREKNPLKKFIQSFKYKRLLKNNVLEDSYLKTVRKMIQDKRTDDLEDLYEARNATYHTIEKGTVEYAQLKDIEDIARMTLISLTTRTDEPIDIEKTCKLCREEMKNTIGTTRIGTDYRQRQVTLGSKTGITKEPIIETMSFEEVPNAIRSLQEEYERAYNEEQNEEDYIRKIAKIYADFVYTQPYEDGNKRTGTCLFNSMLLSKGIVPPVINLVNDEKMVEAYKKAHNKDYTMLQDLIVQKYRDAIGEVDNNANTPVQENSTHVDQEL